MILLLVFILIIGVLLMYNSIDNKQPKEWTDWEFWRNAPPKITVLTNGEKRFQHQEYWTRYNNFTKKWDTKKVLYPKLLRFDEAAHWEDAHSLLNF